MMGDTDRGSWGSNQLLGHMRQEEARVEQEQTVAPRSWAISWYVCYDDTRKELWRVATGIGPITADHDHWAGWYVADQETAEFVKAACEHYEAWLEVNRDGQL